MKRLTLITLTALLAMAMNSSAWWWTRKPAEEPVKEDAPEATQEAVKSPCCADKAQKAEMKAGKKADCAEKKAAKKAKKAEKKAACAEKKAEKKAECAEKKVEKK
ncbi:MAG: hypothetical protein PHR34_04210, partial [Kiritimatiellae bacterium]|nr:hypothetical protein [Kiritimatiellia bacterium]